VNETVVDNILLQKILMITCAGFVASLILSEHYGEVFALAANVCMIVIPLELLILVTGWITSCVNKNCIVKSKPVMNLLSIAWVLITIGVFIFEINSVTVEACYSTVSRYQIRDSYYLKSGNASIQVSEKDYRKIACGRDYAVTYKYNKLIPNQINDVSIKKIR
jgi:hypothetical protein